MERVRTGPTAGEAPAPPPAGAPAIGSRVAELVAAAVVLVLGLGAFAGSLALGYWNRGPGPGFFPLWLGVLLALLAVIWAVQAARGRNIHAAEPVPPGGRLAVTLVLAALLAAILLLDVVGYQLAITALVLFLLLVVGRRRWLESVVVALVGGFGIYAVFANVLQVYLPTASVPLLAQWGL
ncbi:tripartite tricarboxylate transporter TctB family protein [Pseudonocardia kunmingensis]|uniref:Putative tricarboxylic transport membrane protein n=1 Tax=Pseudonocardia kunmingensis TaxID=630975 RepID=A0A543DR97_9PSEU|nr:tripartite tricarboxylate transporter TctB family protein [Pseudonocardia kunmingensis]TQM11866.1 putative tricarboxylic transport membrane protein [Pseudonocardia kunmingensis]